MWESGLEALVYRPLQPGWPMNVTAFIGIIHRVAVFRVPCAAPGFEDLPARMWGGTRGI